MKINNMNSNRFFKKSIMLFLILLSFNALVAQDRITFTWKGSHGGYVYGGLVIKATDGELFTINWGDDTPIETKTGLGNTDIYLYHESFREECTVTIAASSTDCKFTYFDCYTYITDDVTGFQILSLTLDGCSDLAYLYCEGNALQLSDLYAAHLIINEQSGKLFGTQFLPYQPLTGGMTVDFSAQRIFGGVETVFDIWKGGQQAIYNVDYAIDNGIITFISDEIYTVTMTNGAIISHPNYPASVVAGVDLTSVNIIENSLSSIKIYPNPTIGELIVGIAGQARNDVRSIEVFDISGRSVLSHTSNLTPQTSINISHLPAGTYFVKIMTEQEEVVRKVVKQ